MSFAFIFIMIISAMLQILLVRYSSIPSLGFDDPQAPLFTSANMLPYIININAVLIIPLFVKVYGYFTNKENRILTLSHEKTNAELLFLRSQIQPHFFFNVLNDLYAMALKKSDKTPEMILTLSHLMRYVLYESSEEYVPLEKELTYIKNYINLELLRYNNRFNIKINIEGNIDHIKIAPLIILPLVENAFKHSNPTHSSKIWIIINITLAEDELIIIVSNSFNSNFPKQNTTQSGIGIQNILFRLDHIYPHQYSFENEITDENYTNTLKIKIK
ncbi:MAG: histidine kinase [Bacteroides sp.]|jgi:LytS/YehU family sensor histidine kinase|nr:histidine kinase [Bacteroides sp.]